RQAEATSGKEGLAWEVPGELFEGPWQEAGQYLRWRPEQRLFLGGFLLPRETRCPRATQPYPGARVPVMIHDTHARKSFTGAVSSFVKETLQEHGCARAAAAAAAVPAELSGTVLTISGPLQNKTADSSQ
ncbi:hypothetical protein H8959_005026, partial [Pygathrix nigripes]